jgi:hypothetical protein
MATLARLTLWMTARMGGIYLFEKKLSTFNENPLYVPADWGRITSCIQIGGLF